MHVDILIFAAIAAFLVYKLNGLLGTRHGDERSRPNPFTDNAARGELKPAPLPPTAAAAVPAPVPVPLATPAELIDPAADKEGLVAKGLAEIAAADAAFDPGAFMEGARHAFEMIATAFAKGNIAALKPLLSPKLYNDFAAAIDARKAKGHTAEVVIHRIKAARFAEAHMGGVMAYVTVDYDVEETAVTRDAAGNPVEGDPDRILEVEDLWTFSRDIRSPDPNWVLVETRAA